MMKLQKNIEENYLVFYFPNWMNKSSKLIKFEKKILDLVVCPKTKQPLIWNKKNNELISKKAKLAYPIINGIPVLVVEKARKLK